VTPRAPAFLLLAAALATPLAARAQEKPQPADQQQAPVFSTGTDIVNVTVTVRDPQGRLLSDLKREDFVVQEDGRPQTVQVFARAVEPGESETLALDLGLLLDTSESMLKQLRLSQQAAVRFLQAIPRARDLITIFFDEDIRLSRYDSENQQGLIERIETIKGGGWTALYDAMALYIARVQDSTGRKVLVLFTDGEDSRSAINLGELLQTVRSSAVTIYPIGFMGSFPTGSTRMLQSRAFLQQMADITGGQLFTPATSKDLPGIYAKILDELSAQYVIGFVSDNQHRDGKFRKLKVDVRRDGLKVRHRTGYFAPDAKR
jgi:Ca-activated chloride channel family protein